MTVEMDGSVRIGWSADEHSEIRVLAPRRETHELVDFARRVADHALLARSLAELRKALRDEFKATFDIESREPSAGAGERYVLVRLHPPKGEPNPEE